MRVPALPRHQGLGHSCDAIAVTGIPRSPEDRLLKDDRRDAQRLPSEMTKVDSKLKTVYVPTTRVESLGDLTRARYDAVAASRRSKQLVQHAHALRQRAEREDAVGQPRRDVGDTGHLFLEIDAQNDHCKLIGSLGSSSRTPLKALASLR